MNLRQTSRSRAITAGRRLQTSKRKVDVDVIVFATGFDAMTGAIKLGASHHRTRRQVARPRSGAHGPQSYLGLTVARLPQPVHDHRSGEPVGAVEHGRCRSSSTDDWVVDRLDSSSSDAGFTTMEATETAQAGWDTAHGRLQR